MQSVSSRIWTRIAVFISYGDNDYTTGTSRFYNDKQKRRTCKIVDFAVPADHGVKLKESEKKDKYLDLTRE